MIVVWEDNRGLEGIRFFFSHECISHDDDGVTNMYEVSGGTIDADTTATAFARNDVGLDACAVGVIYDLHFLACVDIGGIHEVLINSDTTDII